VEEDSSPRRRILRVTTARSALFVKVVSPADPFGAAELAVHRAALDGGLDLGDISPPCLVVDPVTGLLVFPLLGSRRSEAVTGDRARAFGHVLRAVHGAARAPRPELPVVRPWALALDLGEPALPPLTPASTARAVLSVVSRAEVRTALERLRRTWVADAFVHGDLRSSNVLARPQAVAGPGLWLVDWENAGFGDPSWDVGCVLADWTAPALWSTHDGAMLLHRTWPAFRAFWQAYGGDDAGRAVAMAGARLLQTCVEWPAGAVPVRGRVLNLGTNVLASPAAAAREVFGL
jgi:hypothetical protein